MRDGVKCSRVLTWIAAALVAIVAAVAYLHTEHAFRAVVAPLVDAALDGSLRVEGGSLRASGRIAASGVTYRSDALDVDIETATIAWAPFSLLWGERLRIEELTLLGVEVALRPGERSVEQSDGGDTRSWRGYELDAPLLLPIAIERARAEGRWVRRGNAGEMLERWSSVRLAVEDLDAAQRARLVLSADVEIDPDAPERGYAGRATLEAKASADEAGQLRELLGIGQVDLVPLSAPDAPPLRFVFELSREASEDGGARASALAHAMREQSELGRARVALRALPDASAASNARPGAEATSASLELSVEVQEVTHDFVNPLIAPHVAGRLASGVIDGSFEGVWSPADRALRARTAGTIRDLRLSAGGEQTPPLAFRASWEGTWVPSERLEIPSGEASLDAAGRRVVDLRLRAPLHWRRDAAAVGASAAAPAEPELELRIQDLDLAQLRAGFALFDLPLAVPLENAHLDAALRASALRTPGELAVAGTWRLRDLGEPDDRDAPLTLSGVIDARAVPPRGGRVEKLEAELARGERALAALRGSGSFAAGGERAQIDWALAAPDLSAALEQLDALAPPLATKLRRGRLDAQGALAREAAGAPLRVSGAFRIDDLDLRGAQAWTTSLTGSAQIAFESNAIAVEHVEIERREGGKDVPAATLAFTGTVPLARGARAEPVSLELRLEERDARPWFELTGLDAAFATEPVPLQGAWDVRIDPTDLAFHAEGAQSIGLRFAGLREMRMRQRATRSPSGLIEFEAKLHGERERAPHDRAEITGSFQPGSAPADAPDRLDLSARIESLALGDGDLRIYDSDLTANLELARRGARHNVGGMLTAGHLALESSAEEKPRTPLAQAPLLDAPLPHTHAPDLDAELGISIDRLVLFSDAVERIVGQFALADGRVRIQLGEARLWGGALAADFASHWDEPTPTVALRAALAHGNIARFFEGRRASGGLDAAIDLSGTGDSLRALLASARGEAELLIGEVEFQNEPLGVLGKDLLQILFSEIGPGRGGQLNCVVTRSDVYDGLGRVGVVMSTRDTTLAGGGALDLRGLSAELVLRSRSKRASVGAVRAPIRVAGPLDDLRAGLDAASVAKESAKVVALGMINPFLIVIPFVDLGSGGENPCEEALESLTSEGPPNRTLLDRSRRLLGDTDRSLRQWLGGEPEELPQ